MINNLPVILKIFLAKDNQDYQETKICLKDMKKNPPIPTNSRKSFLEADVSNNNNNIR